MLGVAYALCLRPPGLGVASSLFWSAMIFNVTLSRRFSELGCLRHNTAGGAGYVGS